MGSLGGENGGKSKQQSLKLTPQLPPTVEWRLGKLSYCDGTLLLSKIESASTGHPESVWTLYLLAKKTSGLLRRVLRGSMLGNDNGSHMHYLLQWL